jgi:hypothetical protein
MSFGSGGGNSSSIAGSTDVTLSSPAAEDYLGYDNLTAKWENMTLAGKAALVNGGGLENVWFNYSASGAITLDLANGNTFRLTLSANITLAFTGAVNNKVCSFTLYIKHGTSGQSVSWPSSVWWAEGVAPTLSSVASAYDVLVFESIDGGNSWFGSLVGTNFGPAA